MEQGRRRRRITLYKCQGGDYRVPLIYGKRGLGLALSRSKRGSFALERFKYRNEVRAEPLQRAEKEA